MACNYTARAFRALTYLSPGKEKDEKTSAYLLVLTSEYRNLSFLVCFRQLCFSLFFFFFPFTLLARRGLFWKFEAHSRRLLDDFHEKKKVEVKELL